MTHPGKDKYERWEKEKLLLKRKELTEKDIKAIKKREMRRLVIVLVLLCFGCAFQPDMKRYPYTKKRRPADWHPGGWNHSGDVFNPPCRHKWLA